MEDKKKEESVTTEMNDEGNKGGTASEVKDLNEDIDYLDESEYGDMTENDKSS